MRLHEQAGENINNEIKPMHLKEFFPKCMGFKFIQGRDWNFNITLTEY